MPRLIDADMLEPSEVYMNYGFTRIVYMDDIDELPTVDVDSLNAKHEDIGYEKGYRDGYAEALEVTVDAEPVRHGRWLSVKVLDDEADFGEVDGAECLICGYTYDSEYWAKTYFNYCPNCGAKMDEVEDG